jgi:hypothetical protein
MNDVFLELGFGFPRLVGPVQVFFGHFFPRSFHVETGVNQQLYDLVSLQVVQFHRLLISMEKTNISMMSFLISKVRQTSSKLATGK